MHRDTDDRGSYAGEALVVDDDPGIRMVLREMFRAEGWATAVATDVESGWAHFSTGWRPDLVLVDFGLPGAPGTELVRRIRLRRDLEGVRVVVCTGESAPARVDEIWRAGSDAVLAKPFCFDDLVQQLGLRRRHSVSRTG